MFDFYPQVSVGITNDRELEVVFNGKFAHEDIIFDGIARFSCFDDYVSYDGYLFDNLVLKPLSTSSTFTIERVTIGKEFHWERTEQQSFNGTLEILVDNGRLHAINILPIEDYLLSVISSEMKATASLELLKAHAVISRSWVLKQIILRGETSYPPPSEIKIEHGYIKWYDSNNHSLFDVCADDHCQRYQGITRIIRDEVIKAVEETKGEVLLYDGDVCDARFSKCCGGVTEEFQYCWENEYKPYLSSVKDEFCNANDQSVLSQVLNDYDLETFDFHDWEISYTVEEMTEIVNSNLSEEIGVVTDIVVLERGKSGRVWLLKICGSKSEITVGKELEIRRILSRSHLKSSWFDVVKEKDCTGQTTGFRFYGHGWGHGVGLCQIGAAMMGEKGYNYKDILKHYYKNAEITRIYK